MLEQHLNGHQLGAILGTEDKATAESSSTLVNHLALVNARIVEEDNDSLTLVLGILTQSIKDIKQEVAEQRYVISTLEQLNPNDLPLSHSSSQGHRVRNVPALLLRAQR